MDAEHRGEDGMINISYVTKIFTRQYILFYMQ